MRWPESSRIDPTIATDGKTGCWALARVDSYTVPYLSILGTRAHAHGDRPGGGEGSAYVISVSDCVRTTHATSPWDYIKTKQGKLFRPCTP
eukprot:6037930-Prymnesium_polylepis.1